MKNKIILIVCFLGLMTFVLTSKNSKINPFIEETKKEMEELETEKEKLFVLADETLVNLEEQRNLTKKELIKLDSTLKIKELKLKNAQITLEESESKIEKLKEETQNYLRQKEASEILLARTKENLIQVKQLNKEKNELLEKVYEEKIILEDKCKSLESIYENSRFISVDTVFMIDTVVYKKDEIKKIKIKSN